MQRKIIKINLAKYLEEKGVSQAQLAKDIGERRATINAMCHNKTKRIPLDLLAKTCEYLNVEVGELLTLGNASEETQGER